MDILREFLDPIPLAAMIAAALAIIAVLVFAWIFRMPRDFADKESFRQAIRMRIACDRMAEKLIEEAVDAKRNAAAETAGQEQVDTAETKPAPEGAGDGGA